MKKLIYLLTIAIISTSLPAFASNIEVQPTMQTRTSAQDRVWVGTFQIVWNDFMDKIVHNTVRFREGTPVMVQELNKQAFKENQLSEKSYYTMTGKVKKNTKKQITKAIKKKFNETSDLLDKLDLTARNDMLIVYAMLKKDFMFTQAFDKLGKSKFGEDQEAEYFGIAHWSDNALGNGVKVLFYNSPEDFAVKLTTKDNDEVFLYRNDSNKSFTYLYDDMNKKTISYAGLKTFSEIDELKVPNLKFSQEKSFDEITGKRIMGTNLVINQAMETIKFNMNHKGVELKSEAAMTVMKMSVMEDLKPRLFNYDDTFVLFLKEKGKESPYFALRVNDITNYQE